MGEYNNKHFHDFFASHGIQFRFSCPQTSQQNGKSERMLRTINNVVRTLLFHSHLPPTFWVEALHMATHLLNILPSTSINFDIPYYRLFQKHPYYSHLRVFGCLCYPHITTPHNLAPRITPCVFLGYPSQHRGFRCLGLSTRRIIISRHVVFGPLSGQWSQSTEGIDCDETFRPVVKLATIRTVLSIAVSQHWPIHQLDVKNAFLHGHLQETVYMHQPPASVILDTRNMFVTFSALFMALSSPPERGIIGLPTSSKVLLRQIISQLGYEFAMTDVGALSYFLGISTSRSSTGLFLSQQKYATEILERAHMLNCKPARTPAEPGHKLGADGPLWLIPRYIAALPGLFSISPSPDRILHLQGTLTHGLQLHVSPSSDLIAYTDADWEGCPASRRSTSSYCVFLGDNLVSWSSKRQGVILRSSAEAEYRGVANVVAETSWIRNLLRKLHRPPTKATIVYCDNVSAVYMSSNPVQHQRTKHIDIDIHFVRDKVAIGHVRVLHVP
ncbi:hypothetical protein OSB04_020103 [Centaurea solstitialis]|uniref:Integrase catalytic domain-containing protein n=1 Tax=Centaurea solstitialis TaxID=347529 RepID=A0AA38SRK6_9ASTR|nr:hypothetical protein OSB04_020103 [Centaurea solstitialis]